MNINFTKIWLFSLVLLVAFSCQSYKAKKLKEEAVVVSDPQMSNTQWANYPEDNLNLNAPKSAPDAPSPPKKAVLGVEKYKDYLPYLNNKNVAVFINHTSQLNGILLHEALLKQGIYVKKIFTPEHGLKANADAGAKVDSKIDEKTGIPIKSLYGAAKKPSATDLANIDVVVFDMQDVGCRFYTYISSLEYMMMACAQNGVQLLILDRPNPNGHYVDGPVLKKGFESFVGMQRIPIVHGMTMGEYALMLKGQKWFEGASKLKLKIIPCSNYTHSDSYSIDVFPSPNLRTNNAIQLYPALCLFEGTDISVGRGTDFPFECFGSPKIKGLKFNYSFIPKKSFGASEPMFDGKVCNGLDLRVKNNGVSRFDKIPLHFIIDAYYNYRSQKLEAKFFNSFFNKLAGNAVLKEQIIKGMSEDEIRATWQKDLNAFKKIRKEYILYPDFE